MKSIKMRAPIWTKEEKETLIENYALLTKQELLKTFPNRTYASIVQRARMLGAKDIFGKKHRKYTLNNTYFSNINIQNCYWAGFLAADGYIPKNYSGVQIHIHGQDTDLLHAFCENIGYDGKILTYDSNNKPRARLCIKSKSIAEDLRRNFKITNAKSKTLQPPQLKGESALAFIKGLIDGDGSICYAQRKNKNYTEFQLILLGTSPMLAWVKKVFSEKFGKDMERLKIHQHPNCEHLYRLTLNKKRALRVCRQLDSLPTFRLSRKWDALTFVEEESENEIPY